MAVSRDINMSTKMSRSHVDSLIYARNSIQLLFFQYLYLPDLAVKSTCFDCRNNIKKKKNRKIVKHLKKQQEAAQEETEISFTCKYLLTFMNF